MNKNVFIGGLKATGRMLLAGFMCLIVSISVVTILDNQFGRILCQIINLTILISISYTATWNEGNNDVNKINYERMQRDEYKGVKYGIIAAVPGFLLYIFLLLIKFGPVNDAFLTIYRFLNPVFMPLNSTLMPATLTAAEIPAITFILVGLESLLPLIICGFAYVLGLRRYSIMERFIYPYAPVKKKKSKLRKY